MIEKLADAEHASWARWMDYLFTKGTHHVDGSFTLPWSLVERWLRQAATPYADLSEREKQSDRDEVAAIVPFIEAEIDALRAEQTRLNGYIAKLVAGDENEAKALWIMAEHSLQAATQEVEQAEDRATHAEQALAEAERSRDAYRATTERHIDRLLELEAVAKEHHDCPTHIKVLLETRESVARQLAEARAQVERLREALEQLKTLALSNAADAVVACSVVHIARQALAAASTPAGASEPPAAPKFEIKGTLMGGFAAMALKESYDAGHEISVPSLGLTFKKQEPAPDEGARGGEG